MIHNTNNPMYLLFQTPEHSVTLTSKENLFAKSVLSRNEYEEGGAIGHFDWLKTTDGKIIGVRLWPFSDGSFKTNLVIEAFRKTPFTLSEGDRYICFFFKQSETAFDEELSQHQELSDCGALALSNGKNLIYFDARHIFHEYGFLELGT